MIEHGILRRSQWKFGLGYLGKWFVSNLEKRLRVAKLDFRIHFARNCGAESCPAIHYYQSPKIDAQLEKATKSFLANDIAFDDKLNKLTVSRIFLWFSGDFGGPAGIKKIVSEKLGLATNKRTEIIYKEYDWTLALRID